jgi:hypothetical protein
MKETGHPASIHESGCPRTAPGATRGRRPVYDVAATGRWRPGHRLVAVTAALAAIFAMLAGAAPVASAVPCGIHAYPPSLCTITVSTTQVTAGHGLVISATGFQPRAELRIYLRSRWILIGTAHADSAGRLTTRIRIPASVRPGRHRLSVTGLGRNSQIRRTLAATIIVARHRGHLPPPVPGSHTVLTRGLEHGGGTSSGGGLAGTGSSVAVPVGALGVILVLMGGGAVAAARRRRRVDHAAAPE